MSWVCIRKGARGWTGPDRSSPLPRRTLSCARPALLPDQALNIWVSRGGPGRVRRAAQLESLPTRLLGSRLPFPAASKNGGTPTRTLQDVAFLGCLLPSHGPLSTVLVLKGLSHRPKILTPGTGFCLTASFLALFSSFHYVKALNVPVFAGGYEFF